LFIPPSLYAKFNGFGLLSGMGMLSSTINFEFGKISFSQLVAWQHAFDSYLHHLVRVVFQQLTIGFGFDSTRISGMPVIKFVIMFLAVSLILSALMITTKSPQSTLGVKIGLCLPRRRAAT
jgi:hypothetical protein